MEKLKPRAQHVHVLLFSLIPLLTLFTMEKSLESFLQIPRQRKPHLPIFLFLALSTLFLAAQVYLPFWHQHVPHVSITLSRCQQIQLKPGPPPTFHGRTHSDRYVAGTKPILLKHAKIWTGGKNGTEIVEGDILLDKGLIKAVGYVPRSTLNAFHKDLVIFDAKDAWVTPGIVDMHSHIGNNAAPELAGASEDYNSDLGNIQVNIIYSVGH
jgi:hypothetical protein